MSILDDIRRDMEAGTPGPWENFMGDVQHEDLGGDYLVVCGIGKSVGARSSEFYPIRPHKPQGQANARRIARVPQMEAALLAAEELAELLDQVQRQGCEICNGDCASATPPVGYCPMQVRQKALAAYRKATEGTE